MLVFHSKRLFLRTWQASDIEHAFKLWGDPEVTKFIDARGALTREQVQDKLNAELEFQQKYDVQYWPIFEKDTNEFVGCSGLKPWLHSSRGGNELGFHIVKEKWGNAYALEAAQTVVNYAFQEKQFSHLMAGHHPSNTNSQKILGKLGFQFLEEVFFKPTGLMHLSYRLDNAELSRSD